MIVTIVTMIIFLSLLLLAGAAATDEGTYRAGTSS